MRRCPALVAASLAVALGACESDPSPPVQGAPADPVRPGNTAAAPADDGVVVPSPRAATPEARLDGFGPLQLGMDIEQAGAAWPGLFEGAGAEGGCFHASGGLSHFGMMFDDGRFVRYGGSNDEITAPGGGKRGMDETALRALYQDAFDEAPDRFAPGGKRLSIDTSGVAPSRLVFVLRPDGVVNEWYVGLSPQIDYESACEDAPGS